MARSAEARYKRWFQVVNDRIFDKILREEEAEVRAWIERQLEINRAMEILRRAGHGDPEEAGRAL